MKLRNHIARLSTALAIMAALATLAGCGEPPSETARMARDARQSEADTAAVAAGASIASARAWRRYTSMPTARQEVYVTTRDKLIYVAGGILADGLAFTDAFEVYDSDSDSWSLLAPLPAPRHHITLSAVNGKIYAVGGFIGPFPDWRALPDVFIYDVKSNTWTDGVPLPAARGEHVSAVVDNKVYIIGGRVRASDDADHFFEHVDTTLNQVFDPATGTWSDLAPAPTSRNSAAAGVIDGRIYVVGGRENIPQADGTQSQVNVATLEVYDPATDTWTTRAPMPQAQGGLAAAALGGRLYAFGGEQWTPEQKVFGEGWVYDPATDSWAALSDMPTPRHGLLAAAAGDAIYVIGGAMVTGGGAAVGTNEAYRP